MSKASYWQRGETLDYKNTGSSTIEANTVVELTGRVGIAGTDIAPGAEGDLHVCGVFEFDKTGTNEIAFGQPVYFDKTGITDAANNGETSGSKVAYTPCLLYTSMSEFRSKSLALALTLSRLYRSVNSADWLSTLQFALPLS